MSSSIKYALTAALVFYTCATFPASELPKKQKRMLKKPKTDVAQDQYTMFMNQKDAVIDTWHDFIMQHPTALTLHNINASNSYKSTALHMRSNCPFNAKELPSIAALLDMQAHINAQDNAGNTPLHIAASSFNPDRRVVQALIDGKSDLSIKNNHGFNPLRASEQACRGVNDPTHSITTLLKQAMEEKPEESKCAAKSEK